MPVRLLRGDVPDMLRERPVLALWRREPSRSNSRSDHRNEMRSMPKVISTPRPARRPRGRDLACTDNPDRIGGSFGIPGIFFSYKFPFFLYSNSNRNCHSVAEYATPVPGTEAFTALQAAILALAEEQSHERFGPPWLLLTAAHLIRRRDVASN